MRRRATSRAAARGGLQPLRLATRDIYVARPLDGRRGDVGELAASIARHGLLSPLVVREEAQSGRYALVCGARRLLACRLLGIEEVDALRLDGDETDALACFLEEHACRREVPCADEARLIAHAEGLKGRFALPDGYLARRERLLALGERVLALAADAGLSLEQAEPLLLIAGEDKRLEAASLIAQRGLSGRGARRLVVGEERDARSGSGAREGRAMRRALDELSAACDRLRSRGMDARMSVRSQEGGFCVQITMKNSKSDRNMQEKSAQKEN